MLLRIPATNLQREPFGEDVEGLSHCGAKTYAVERKVQTEDFEEPPLFGNIRAKPFVGKRLRKFKHLKRQFSDFRLLPILPFKLNGKPCAFIA
jgi:hypothetical protein